MADGFTIVGCIFERSNGAVQEAGVFPDLSGMRDFERLCQHLVHSAWGAYVLLGRGKERPGGVDVFRDPIGMLDAFTWRSGSVRLIGSHPEQWLDICPADDVAIDWPRIAELLAFPGSVAEASALHGVDAVPAGVHMHMDTFGAGRSRRFWSPVDYCQSRSVDASAEALADVVDSCVGRWRRSYDMIASEVSGGLDSAIVAASGGRNAPRIQAAFNFFSGDAGGDERSYARAVCEYLSISLRETECDVRGFNVDDVSDMPIGVRPGLGSVSLFHDRKLARELSEFGADAMLTGQGGDAVFFQPATPLVASDQGLTRLLSSPTTLMDIARWTRVPVWPLLKQALRSAAAHKAFSVPPNGMPACMPVKPGKPHYDWLSGAEHLPPAKQLQIWALINSRAAFGPSWCSSVVEVIHPLMSQPLVEHVLGLSTLQLTEGRRNRGLARRAFAGRLPRVVIDRTGKGALTFHFGRRLARSSRFLRSFLLDGLLAAKGIVDPNALEAVLTSQALMQSDVYSELLTMILLEQWVRTWQARLEDISSRSWGSCGSAADRVSRRWASNQ
ncbi:asparagine synthase C-terminal domain-containing protein [Sphingomonas abietis]|uniref:asparagine synthase C-terminal domain-containing protein n=1 Tax=Sphingomonas abietis TaxID=3012344 RepID=UPI002DD63F2D|nr:asparagine synthase C-terminal domain-containing protein [Sphingomonas abietis]